MQPTLLIEGMHGLGDNLHQRALIRQWCEDRFVWLETPWPSLYHDLVGPRLKLYRRGSRLRTQAKNEARQAALYSTEPRPIGEIKKIWYTPQAVRKAGSVLGAMIAEAGLDPAKFDFRLPVHEQWKWRAINVLRTLKLDRGFTIDRPLMIVRPLVERTEWSGCAARNPDGQSYAELFNAIRDKFFVISVADLVPGKEWLAGDDLAADVSFHAGELEIETLVGLVSLSSLVFASPGFAIPLAQALGRPSVCVFGGYEAGTSFSLGARLSPHLAIEPINSCGCWRHDHACDKTIDLPVALRQLREFADAAAHH